MKKICIPIFACLCLLLLGTPVSAASGLGGFSPLWPVSGSYQINSLDYYYSSGSAHRPMKAIDIGRNGADTRDILAAAAGKVVTVSNLNNSTGYGNFIILDHENGYYTRYAHLKENSITVKTGDRVGAGQKIALMGTTGNSTGVHLHFEIGTSQWMGSLEYALDYFLVNSNIYPLLSFCTGLEKVSARYGALIHSSYTKKSGSYYGYNGTVLDLGFIDGEIGDGNGDNPSQPEPPVEELPPVEEPEPPVEEPKPADPNDDLTEGTSTSTLSAAVVRTALSAIQDGDFLDLVIKEKPTTTQREYKVTYSALYEIANTTKPAGLKIGDAYGMFVMDKLYANGLVAHANGKDVTFVLQRSPVEGEALMHFTMGIRNSAGEFITSGGIGRCTLEVAYTAAGNGNTLAIYTEDNKPVAQSAYIADSAVVRWTYGKEGVYQLKNAAREFTDIDHWGKDYVDFLSARGVINGMTATTFVPDGAITRAQFVKILATISGATLEDYSDAGFNDVKASDWHYKYVNWAVESAVVNGTSDTTFEPDAPITREQMAAMLYRLASSYLKYDIPAVRPATSFNDAGAFSTWSVDAIRVLQAGGIINGRGNNLFEPAGGATRAEAATVAAIFVSGLVLEP